MIRVLAILCVTLVPFLAMLVISRFTSNTWWEAFKFTCIGSEPKQTAEEPAR